MAGDGEHQSGVWPPAVYGAAPWCWTRTTAEQVRQMLGQQAQALRSHLEAIQKSLDELPDDDESKDK